MKEKEYTDATDLAKLRMAKTIIGDCMCMDDPNGTRLRSVMANIQLMIEHLHQVVILEDET